MIVFNTLTYAVSEYDFDFDSMTETHAGDVNGLYTLGGDDDNGTAITATIKTGLSEWGSSQKKFVDAMYFAIEGEGGISATVDTPSTTWTYAGTMLESGETRVLTGRGIRENHLGFGMTTQADFRLDKLEVKTREAKRKV